MINYFIEVYLNFKYDWSLRVVERKENGTVISVTWLASFQSYQLLNAELAFYDFPLLASEDVNQVDKIIEAIKSYKINKSRAEALIKTGWNISTPP